MKKHHALIEHIDPMCYNAHMDTTIRNLDRDAYRALKGQAALEGTTIGDLVNRAIRSYLAQCQTAPKTTSIQLLKPAAYPPGNDRLSEEIDTVVYGPDQAVS